MKSYSDIVGGDYSAGDNMKSSSATPSEILDPYPPGAQIEIRIQGQGDVRQGEVLAWDAKTKLIVVKKNGGSEGGKSDVNIFNMDKCQSINCLSKPNASPPPIPKPDFDKIRTKLERNMELRQRSFRTVDVDPIGQHLFLVIQKTIEEVRWDGNKIMIYDNVILEPPYEPTNLRAVGNQKHTATTIDHISKLIRRELTRINWKGGSTTKQQQQSDNKS